MLGLQELWGALEGSPVGPVHMFRVSTYVHGRACVCVSVHVYDCLWVALGVMLGLLLGFSLLGWVSYLLVLHFGGRLPLPHGLLPSGQPTFQSCPRQGSDLSVTVGLYFCRRGVLFVPRYSHNALQDSERWAWGAWRGWAVSHWLDCCFLMGL